MATMFLVALGLVMSILLYFGNAHAADHSVSQTSIHQVADGDTENCPRHMDGMQCCSLVCAWSDSLKDIHAVPNGFSVVKWAALHTAPAQLLFSPPRRPPQA